MACQTAQLDWMHMRSTGASKTSIACKLQYPYHGACLNDQTSPYQGRSRTPSQTSVHPKVAHSAYHSWKRSKLTCLQPVSTFWAASQLLTTSRHTQRPPLSYILDLHDEFCLKSRLRITWATLLVWRQAKKPAVSSKATTTRWELTIKIEQTNRQGTITHTAPALYNSTPLPVARYTHTKVYWQLNLVYNTPQSCPHNRSSILVLFSARWVKIFHFWNFVKIWLPRQKYRLHESEITINYALSP